jgi:hypothetical protein
MTSQTGNVVTSRFVDNGFLSVFNTHYLSNTHRLKVTPNLWIVDYGGMSISTARGRLKPEVRSPVDRATTVFFSYFVDTYMSILHHFDVINAFLLAENGTKTISAARGRVKPELKSPFDSLTSIRYGSGFGILRLSFTVSKVIRLYRF